MPANTPTPASKPSRGSRIKYVGTADTREITAAQFRRAGVEHASPTTVLWNAANGHSVKSEDLSFLSDDEFERIIAGDANFKVEE